MKKIFTFQYVSINTSVSLSGSCQIQTLHSNMFLLIHQSLLQTAAQQSYFTFQYVSINTGQERWKRSPSKTFTFQYVSINTDVDFQNGEVIVFFTFQYVSINTTRFHRRNSFRNPLHSNMFLLILFALLFCCLSYLSLHSNMFLLIRHSQSYEANHAKGFTFQYVSINTRSQRHSSCCTQLYIPICFY